MGSQTLEILRQGVWASLTGGFFYDPHQNVFCNAVHLYLWLFLVCAPFVTYLYFPKTFTTWCIYCVTTAFTMTVLKMVNMALHVLYDKAQTMSDPNLKKPLKGLKETEGEDDCGIEMQVLGTDAPSAVSAEPPSDDNSGANSLVSIDCQEHVTSTIDLKVDVHRKNSSESSDSVGMYPSRVAQSSNGSGFVGEAASTQTSNPRRTLKVKSQSEEKASQNPISISEEIIEYEGDKIQELGVFDHPNDATGKKEDRKSRKMKNRLHRQSSLDANQQAEMAIARERAKAHLSFDLDNENMGPSRLTRKYGVYGSSKLQRHRSSENNDDRHLRNRNHCFSYQHKQPGTDMRHHLQSLASDFYLEKNYTKSDFGIENIENENSKMYLLQQPKPMRKDSSSTMSALQLPVACTSSNNSRKRRHSNTGCKPQGNQMSSVRRIKSAALEISCPQPSVSNLSPHPNSVEAIAGQQLRNPQSAVLPPPSKSLVRNPHLNLCPKVGSLCGNSNGAITDPVYPIAELADERSIHEGYMFTNRIESEEDDDMKEKDGAQKRSSTTESESDYERPRTQSTDSDTENNGSRSPLLYKNFRSSDKSGKGSMDDGAAKYKQAAPGICVAAASALESHSHQSKSADSGCPSSDCEHASVSSKDLLLSKEIGASKKGTDPVWVDYNSEIKIITIGVAEKTAKDDDSIEVSVDSNQVKDPRSSGAIPKVPSAAVAKEDDDFKESVKQKRNLGAIPKSTSRASSSTASSRSMSVESFEYSTRPPNEIYRSSKDQWIVMGPAPDHTSPSMLQSGDVLFNNSRRVFLDNNYRMQPKHRRSSESTRRSNLSESKISKIDTEIITGIEFGADVIQNSATTSLSAQERFITEQYSFEKSLTSEHRPSGTAIVNISRVDFGDSVYCDYWRPYTLSAEKHTQPKRFYKYPLKFFGRRELKIAMDRLQLLALFDRDLNFFHATLAIILSILVCLFGSIILQMDIYKDIFAFLFCLVIAGSQYSLLKSVQPDAASPIHGFNKTVAYSRPIYFCICSGLLVFSHHMAKQLAEQNQTSDLKVFGLPFSPETIFSLIARIMAILILFFPVFFSLGLFPQINTFVMYILEQIDMHIFGGSAACSLLASVLCVSKSIIAVCILYGPALGGLTERKGTQHILFSIFCAILIPVAYHLSRSASDFTHLWALIKSSLVTYTDEEEDSVEFKKSTSELSESQPKSDLDNKENESNKSQTLNDENSFEDAKVTDETAINSERKASHHLHHSKSGPIEGETAASVNTEPPDPLPKKLQSTVNSRLKNDILISSVLALIVLGLHCSTVFTVLQPDLNIVLYSIAGILGFIIHYVIPHMRKLFPWLCFARPILKQQEYGKFEVAEAAKIMWFEKTYVVLSFLERNVLYPLIFISALTADSSTIVQKYGPSVGTIIVAVCGLKCIRSAYSDSGSQYIILIFSVLLFRIDFNYASETFLVDYFFVSIIYKKSCEFLLKLQFIVTYIAPWQITWGSAFHAFAQPFSVPHSAMLFLQAAISAILSTPLNPFLGSAIFLTSYVRPIKFWERDYNTRRIDHSNTRLSSQLERDLGADDNNLNSIFYEHLTRSLQHSLCGDILLGRWGNVNQGDCFVLASDYLNCLVHVIELGNGLCTFQMRGLEFRGTYCQQREVEAISEGVEDNDGCCCCSPGHLPQILSANAMFSTRWLAWQVVAAQYVLEGYSISENLATATLQVFEFRKVLITYYIKSIIYYTIRNSKLNEWLAPGPIQDALSSTLNRQFVDLDPIFNYNLDEDFDFRALGITRSSFCSVYMSWIQFCYGKRHSQDSKDSTPAQNESPKDSGGQASGQTAEKPGEETSRRSNEKLANLAYTSFDENANTSSSQPKNATENDDQGQKKTDSKSDNLNNGAGSGSSQPLMPPTSSTLNVTAGASINSQSTPPASAANNNGNNNNNSNSIVTKDSPLISLCLALGLLARRSLATASHSSLSGVEFFFHGLHALFKGDFRITSPRDEWVFGDMELLHGVVAPAVKMALKLHQDHFSSPDEYLDPAVLYEAITTHTKDLVISHEADPVWRSAVLRGAPNLLALRHVMEDGSDEYRIIRLTKRFLSFRVIKLNRECVRGLWAGQQQELIYLRNRNPERGSIQNAKQALRNIINSSCDQPIGYPIYVSPLITSYAETNEQLCRIVGGSVTLDKIRCLILDCWGRIRQRCREGCSSGSGGIDCDTTNDVPGVYFSPTTGTNTFSGTAGTFSYGSQSLSGAGTRGSLACINKPTSSTLLAGFLNRERDQDRESVRDRSSATMTTTSNKKNFQSRTDRERRATLPITSETAISNGRDDLVMKDSMGSTNSGLKQLATSTECTQSRDEASDIDSNTGTASKHSTSTGNLNSSGGSSGGSGSGSRGGACAKYILGGSMKFTANNQPEPRENINLSESRDSKVEDVLIELNKKVIIVDGMEIYDCLDLGRRIDVVWPNEEMRSNGGRSSWKDWSPQEGMVGFVVHYWQPNHPDQRFRSSVNRLLYLVEIGEHFVPVGESGIKEYNQIRDSSCPRLSPATPLTASTSGAIAIPSGVQEPDSHVQPQSQNTSSSAHRSNPHLHHHHVSNNQNHYQQQNHLRQNHPSSSSNIPTAAAAVTSNALSTAIVMPTMRHNLQRSNSDTNVVDAKVSSTCSICDSETQTDKIHRTGDSEDFLDSDQENPSLNYD